MYNSQLASAERVSRYSKIILRSKSVRFSAMSFMFIKRYSLYILRFGEAERRSFQFIIQNS